MNARQGIRMYLRHRGALALALAIVVPSGIAMSQQEPEAHAGHRRQHAVARCGT
jgi:hypothetical protein